MVATRPPDGAILKKYDQGSIKKRIEAFFLDNLGKVVTREQIIEVSKNPKTGKQPENWHQRLSELRTDDGYTILSNRDRKWLGVQEYLMPDSTKNERAGKRVLPTKSCWAAVLKRAGRSCEWTEGTQTCGLKDGDLDPIGGGMIKLTPDHLTPHSFQALPDVADPNEWRALCGRHQVMKKNYWDNKTGKLNAVAIIQAATENEKRRVLLFLKDYFGEE